MESLLIWLLSLPRVVTYAIFGALGGVAGVLLSSPFSKIVDSKRATQIITIICIVIAIQIPNHLLPKLEKEVATTSVMNDLKDQRLFSVIFRLHPEAENELKMRMDNIIRNSPRDRIFYDAQAASGEIVSRYYQKHLAAASDAVTHKLLVHNLAVMRKFQSQNKPELCVNYYLGTPQFGKDDITQEFIDEESNLKADIIESAVANPSLPPKAASIESLLEIIAGVYQQKGYDINNLAKLDQVATIPASEGCEVGIEFNDAVASLDEKQSAYVFKNLMYMAQE